MTHQHPAGFRSALRRIAAALTLAVASVAALSAQIFGYGDATYLILEEEDHTCAIINSDSEDKIVIPAVAYDGDVAYTVTEIGYDAFMHHSITAVEMPSTITAIGSKAFYNCENLTDVKLSSSLQSIGDYAFEGCTSLAEMELPASVSSISLNAFWGCENLAALNVDKNNTSFQSVDGVLFDAQGVFMCPEGKKGSFSIPERTDIGEVTAIGNNAFYRCKYITEISVPSTLTSIIGENPFKICEGLTSFKVALGSTSFQAVDGVLFDCDGLKIYPPGRAGSYVVPEETEICGAVTSIADHAFYACDELTQLTLPASLTDMNDAISACSALTDINVAEGNTVFQSVDGVLYDCNGVRQCPTGKTGHYVIPSRTDICGPVTTIQDFAFTSCGKLTEVTIPSTVTTIGGYVFYWSGITKLNVFALTPPSVDTSGRFGPLGIEDMPGHVVRVPYGTLEAYSKSEGWSGLNLVEMTQEESALDEVRSADSEAVDVYTLQGVCVKRGACRADVEALPAGLYLVGGQKRLVR